MGIFDKKTDYEIWVDQYLFDNRLNHKLGDFLGTAQYNAFKKKCYYIMEYQGPDKVIEYIDDIYNNIESFNENKENYIIQGKLADKIYKLYVSDGISRIEKVNGRFLASEIMKLDTIIEQNNKIIELLEAIAKK